jgi:hypothetical protein
MASQSSRSLICLGQRELVTPSGPSCWQSASRRLSSLRIIAQANEAYVLLASGYAYVGGETRRSDKTEAQHRSGSQMCRSGGIAHFCLEKFARAIDGFGKRPPRLILFLLPRYARTKRITRGNGNCRSSGFYFVLDGKDLQGSAARANFPSRYNARILQSINLPRLLTPLLFGFHLISELWAIMNPVPAPTEFINILSFVHFHISNGTRTFSNFPNKPLDIYIDPRPTRVTQPPR